jgi:hypothetical protein
LAKPKIGWNVAGTEADKDDGSTQTTVAAAAAAAAAEAKSIVMLRGFMDMQAWSVCMCGAIG